MIVGAGGYGRGMVETTTVDATEFEYLGGGQLNE